MAEKQESENVAEQQNIQTKYAEFQIIKEQLNEFQQQAQILEEQVIELNMTVQALDDINNIKDKREILVPISQGVFTKAQINKGKFLVNVGGNVLVEKDIDKTKELIQDRFKKMQEMHEQVLANINQLTNSAQAIAEELNKLVSNQNV